MTSASSTFNGEATASLISYEKPSSGDGVTIDFIQDFGRRWEAAWNSHDTARVLALIHPEIRWNDIIFWPDVIHGIADLQAYVEKVWAVMPDVHFKEVQLFSAVDQGRALYLFEQTASAPPSTGTDAKAVTYGCDIFLKFEDGLLSDYMAQYEIVEMMRQFRMLPDRKGRVGGAYLLSLMGEC